jgi:tagatose 1,6-diphosphate aldolase GatY/KbaY
MLVSTTGLLQAAGRGGYAVGAFNIYNLEGVQAVIGAGEALRSPVMLQLHPAALEHGGPPLVALCLRAAADATVPAAVHLDHSASAEAIEAALAAGIRSIMADGSHLPYADNVAFTHRMTTLAHEAGAVVEAELGRISGTEDALSVADHEARMTDPAQAAAFVRATGIDALAVCIGNVHGPYLGPPRLDYPRLAAIRQQVMVPLVLHGASGLPPDMIERCIQLGVCKFNVNTEVRQAYVAALRQVTSAGPEPDLLDIMRAVSAAMQAIVEDKLRLFGSAGRA